MVTVSRECDDQTFICWCIITVALVHGCGSGGGGC